MREASTVAPTLQRQMESTTRSTRLARAAGLPCEVCLHRKRRLRELFDGDDLALAHR